MKTIGIDARLYFQTGVGTYLRNFLHFLSQLPANDLQYYVYVMDTDAEAIHFDNPAFKKIGVSYHWHSFSEQTGFYSQLMNHNLDLMHFTYFSYPVRYTRPYIATVHDLTPIRFRTGKASTKNPLIYGIKHAVFKYVLLTQVSHAKKIITPTETVKKQLLEEYPAIPEQNIISLYEGVDYELAHVKENSELQKKYTKPFFLYVGNFYPHKNVECLVEAFKEVPADYDLILSGPNDFFTERIQALITKNNLEKRIHIHHSKGREDLKFFYNHAVALVHPSLSEGFGLPLVEAMASNVPIIASSIPVFQELLPPDSLLFDPTSSADIARKLQTFLKSPKKGDYSHVMPRYSFENMSKRTLEIYNSLLHE